ncbi:MAG TPA: tRNA preQ1(34) S-adenosylmethionine ribosyltransferase-isomerase QueA [Spirochaetia bacterium]|nr:tRNA preQ1(34) S-adenosylmethionine ribosyltransferase-isomerase QueA [Spirochaetia bacterium]
MKTSDFYFEVPEELIAQKPESRRGNSRLMIVDRHSGRITEGSLGDFISFLEPGSLIVFNNSRVNKARLFGHAKQSGGRTEFLLLAPLEPDLWRVLTSKSKKQITGKSYVFPGGLEGTIEDEKEGLKLLRFNRAIADEYLDEYGSLPLPPYIKRAPTPIDEERYQTVFARVRGSAAAPTAGLHFSRSLLKAISSSHAEVAFITLHIGLGTFLPIRTENVEDHKMHEESLFIPERTAIKVERALEENRSVIAVGTTVVRALEGSMKDGKIVPGWKKTSLFIYPGFRFRVIRHLFTNFHSPGSSLYLLVSAFAGQDLMNTAYDRAIEKKYRFFSYGDAMFLI